MSTRSSSRFGMLISVLVFTVYSICFSILGPSIPEISQTLWLLPLEIGAIIGAVSIGFALASFPAGIASDKIDRRMVFVLGLILMTVGIYAIGLSYSFMTLFLSALAMGAGGGMFEGGINPFVSDLFPSKEGFAINFLHVFWGVGTFIGPLIVAVFLAIYKAWRLSFFLISITAALAAFLSLLPHPRRATNKNRVIDVSLERKPVEYRQFLGLTATAFMIWGVEFSILNWLPIFLTSERGFLATMSAVAAAVFQLFLAIGRILWGSLSDRIGLEKTVRIGAIGGGLLLGIAVMASEQFLIFLSLSASALFLASVLPTLIALGSVRSHSMRGAGSGIVLSSGSVGSIIIPLAIGVVAQYASLSLGLLMVCFIALTISAIRLKGS